MLRHVVAVEPGRIRKFQVLQPLLVQFSGRASIGVYPIENAKANRGIANRAWGGLLQRNLLCPVECPVLLRRYSKGVGMACTGTSIRVGASTERASCRTGPNRSGSTRTPRAP